MARFCRRHLPSEGLTQLISRCRVPLSLRAKVLKNAQVNRQRNKFKLKISYKTLYTELLSKSCRQLLLSEVQISVKVTKSKQRLLVSRRPQPLLLSPSTTWPRTLSSKPRKTLCRLPRLSACLPLSEDKLTHNNKRRLALSRSL